MPYQRRRATAVSWHRAKRLHFEVQAGPCWRAMCGASPCDHYSVTGDFSIRGRHGGLGRLDLMPDLGVPDGFDLHPSIIRALPGEDLFGEIVQHQVTLRRRSEKNEMTASRLRLD